MGSLNLPTCPARHTVDANRATAITRPPTTPPCLWTGMPQAQAQCFAPGWIYAGEVFDFSWRGSSGPGQLRVRMIQARLRTGGRRMGILHAAKLPLRAGRRGGRRDAIVLFVRQPRGQPMAPARM